MILHSSYKAKLEKLEAKLRCSLQLHRSHQRSQSLILAQGLNCLLLIVKVHMMKATMTTMMTMATMTRNQKRTQIVDLLLWSWLVKRQLMWPWPFRRSSFWWLAPTKATTYCASYSFCLWGVYNETKDLSAIFTLRSICWKWPGGHIGDRPQRTRRLGGSHIFGET